MTYPVITPAINGEYVFAAIVNGNLIDYVPGPSIYLVGNQLEFSIADDALFTMAWFKLPVRNTTYAVELNGSPVGPSVSQQPAYLWGSVLWLPAGDYIMTVVDQDVASHLAPYVQNSDFLYEPQDLGFSAPVTTTSSITAQFVAITDWSNPYLLAGVVTQQRVGWRLDGSGDPFTYGSWLSGSETYYVCEELDPGADYEVILEWSTGVSSAQVGSVVATTRGLPPTMPEDLHSVTVTTSTVQMGWDEVVSELTITYTLRWRVTGGSVWFEAQTPDLLYTVDGLSPGTAYDFQVNARNALGVTAFTDTVVVTTVAVAVVTFARREILGGYRGWCGINWNGKTLIGDRFVGLVGRMNFGTFSEYGQMMRAEVTTPVIHKDRKRVFVNKIELDIQSGVGAVSGEFSDPVWVLDWSKDGGRTWEPIQLPRSMGKTGEYEKRLRWLKLGQSRQWIFRLRATDSVRRVIIGTYADIKEGLG